MTGAAVSFSAHGLSVKSGASSSMASESRTIGFLLSVIGFPHADNALIVFPRRPDKNDHAFVQKSHSKIARFSIIDPVVFDRQMKAGEDFARIGKIEPSLFKRDKTFCRIKYDSHLLLLQK
ncbi:hypothetical protein [Neorhizobium galegae]|uniref:hypothetical protein n=1 Tax=Neorhizobium galegae TaxID=399 RepID=UPI003D7C2669